MDAGDADADADAGQVPHRWLPPPMTRRDDDDDQYERKEGAGVRRPGFLVFSAPGYAPPSGGHSPAATWDDLFR